MSDAIQIGIPAWLLDTFNNPIWQHDPCMFRRHSYPASAPERYYDDGDDSTDEFLRPGYPDSEPDRDRPEWCTSPESTGNDLRTIMDRVADPYWSDRGWVLHFIISWKRTNTN